MTSFNAGDLQKKFEEAVNNNDFPAFNRLRLEFLNNYPSFKEAYSTTPTDVAIYSAVFGRTGGHLKQTNDLQAQELLTRGRAASDVFGRLTVAERLEFLKLLREKIKPHEDAIGLVISIDTGKPVELSAKEMAKGAEWFDFAIAEAEAQLGGKNEGTQKLVSRPMGVTQVISAYNYPYALAIGGIVGALAAGNSVVVSAPLKAPNWVFPFMYAVTEAVSAFCADAAANGKPWAEAFLQQAGGLVQRSVGVNSLLTSKVDLVHFVGGDKVGNIIHQSRGVKRDILEMGGSNVVAIMASAAADDAAAQEIAQKIYEGFAPATGQRCTAPRMLCVQEGADAVVNALGKIVVEGDHHIGNPFAKGTKMGPLVDKGARQKMGEAIELAKELGAKVYGGAPVNSNVIPQALNEASFWVTPVVIDWSSADQSDPKNAERLKVVLGEEIFGPLIHILPRVKDIDGAIAATKKYDTHGLAGAIFTADMEEVEKYASSVSVTSLSVNEAPKDRSPSGAHGHPGLATIGGRGHFSLYANQMVVAFPKAKPAAAPAPR